MWEVYFVNPHMSYAHICLGTFNLKEEAEKCLEEYADIYSIEDLYLIRKSATPLTEPYYLGGCV